MTSSGDVDKNAATEPIELCRSTVTASEIDFRRLVFVTGVTDPLDSLDREPRVGANLLLLDVLWSTIMSACCRASAAAAVASTLLSDCKLCSATTFPSESVRAKSDTRITRNGFAGRGLTGASVVLSRGLELLASFAVVSILKRSRVDERTRSMSRNELRRVALATARSQVRLAHHERVLSQWDADQSTTEGSMMNASVDSEALSLSSHLTHRGARLRRHRDDSRQRAHDIRRPKSGLIGPCTRRSSRAIRSRTNKVRSPYSLSQDLRVRSGRHCVRATTAAPQRGFDMATVAFDPELRGTSVDPMKC